MRSLLTVVVLLGQHDHGTVWRAGDGGDARSMSAASFSMRLGIGSIPSDGAAASAAWSK